MGEKEYYITNWKCSNCGAGYPDDSSERILKGVKISDHFRSVECPRCGCKGTRYRYGETFAE